MIYYKAPCLMSITADSETTPMPRSGTIYDNKNATAPIRPSVLPSMIVHSWAENTEEFTGLTGDCECAAGDRRKRDEKARR